MERYVVADRCQEVDNRLSWVLGGLHESYPDAFYVHLVRNEQETARSWHARSKVFDSRGRRKKADTLPTAFSRLFYYRSSSDLVSLETCLGMVRTIHANIREFLKDKPHCVVNLGDEKGFREFLARISAEGDLNKAVETFKTRHNQTKSK